MRRPPPSIHPDHRPEDDSDQSRANRMKPPPPPKKKSAAPPLPPKRQDRVREVRPPPRKRTKATPLPPAPPRRKPGPPPAPPRAPKRLPTAIRAKPPFARRPSSPPPRPPEALVTLDAITDKSWPGTMCVWCRQEILDAQGNRSPGYGGWRKPDAIPSFWRSETGALWQGFACREPHKRLWEGGWGTAYRGTDQGVRYEADWKKQAKRVKETKDNAYPQFDVDYRKAANS